jgi:hypothetical protein
MRPKSKAFGTFAAVTLHERGRQQMPDREIYASSNGDVWKLVKDGEQRAIMHLPNINSGGSAKSTKLDVFLAHEKESPQGQALLNLIASLTD